MKQPRPCSLWTPLLTYAAMKSTLIILLTVLLTITLSGSLSAADKPAKKKQSPKLRHIVSFKFKDDAPEQQIKKVIREFRALKTKIPGILAFETGTNNSPEGLNKGFTHCFIVTFESEAAREAYLPHPEHKKFVEILKPVMEDVFVIDYWINDRSPK